MAILLRVTLALALALALALTASVSVSGTAPSAEWTASAVRASLAFAKASAPSSAALFSSTGSSSSSSSGGTSWHLPTGSREELIVSPDDGSESLYDSIRLANRSLDIFMWKFDEFKANSCSPTCALTRELVRRQRAGVRVRALFNYWDMMGTPECSEETIDNCSKMTQQGGCILHMIEAGIEVRYFDRNETDFRLFHPKVVLVDGVAALVSSFNWKLLTKRDFGIWTSKLDELRWLGELYEYFWQYVSFPSIALADDSTQQQNQQQQHDHTEALEQLRSDRPDTLFAPFRSSDILEYFSGIFDSATEEVLIYNPTFVHAELALVLRRAAERKVAVRLLISNLFPGNLEGELRVAVQECEADVQVRRHSGAHAKAIVVDPHHESRRAAYLGSTNFWQDGMTIVYDAWIKSSQPNVVSRMTAVFFQDWNKAKDLCDQRTEPATA